MREDAIISERQRFDWPLYGMLIRRRRIEMGFRKAEDFAESLRQRERIQISRDTLYKIERGEQIPTATQFMALNIATSSDPFPRRIIDACMDGYWKRLY